ncbi:MAG TPA: hypothetical protein VGO02_10685 [Burkholderiales bacterium]|nr:hypothetical protein [Burkholderiales bacterium]
MKKVLQWVIAGLIAATLGLPALAADDEPKPKPKAKAKAKAKPKAKADKADTKPDAKAVAPASMNERLRRGAENDQKDRARGTGASSGATSSTPSAPSGVDTTR